MLGVACPDDIAKVDSGYKVSFQVDVSCDPYLVLGTDIFLKLLHDGKPHCQPRVELSTLELIDFANKLVEFEFTAPFPEQMVSDPIEVVQLFIVELHATINNLLLCHNRAFAELLDVIVEHGPCKFALNAIIVLVYKNTCKV